jgi:hypothetical protein
MVAEPDNCCVALRARLATVGCNGKLAVVLDRRSVAYGPLRPTLLKLVGERFSHPRDMLEFELDQLGPFDPRSPLQLERVADLGTQKVFVEALILPFGEQQAAELGALMRAERDPERREVRGWEFAQALARRWELVSPDGLLPCRYLDANFTGLPSTGALDGVGPECPPDVPTRSLPADL